LRAYLIDANKASNHLLELTKSHVAMDVDSLSDPGPPASLPRHKSRADNDRRAVVRQYAYRALGVTPQSKVQDWPRPTPTDLQAIQAKPPPASSTIPGLTIATTEEPNQSRAGFCIDWNTPLNETRSEWTVRACDQFAGWFLEQIEVDGVNVALPVGPNGGEEQERRRSQIAEDFLVFIVGKKGEWKKTSNEKLLHDRDSRRTSRKLSKTRINDLRAIQKAGICSDAIEK
ncbi:928_t:CDS:2, partial [Acaulospora colombiana]